MMSPRTDLSPTTGQWFSVKEDAYGVYWVGGVGFRMNEGMNGGVWEKRGGGD